RSPCQGPREKSPLTSSPCQAPRAKVPIRRSPLEGPYEKVPMRRPLCQGPRAKVPVKSPSLTPPSLTPSSLTWAPFDLGPRDRPSDSGSPLSPLTWPPGETVLDWPSTGPSDRLSRTILWDAKRMQRGWDTSQRGARLSKCVDGIP
ncbi:hypothetical protein M885DRAFT_429769, partial [Pelagophyceae sp. CCMP2097]